jgi:hypothetical protein
MLGALEANPPPFSSAKRQKLDRPMDACSVLIEEQKNESAP